MFIGGRLRCYATDASQRCSHQSTKQAIERLLQSICTQIFNSFIVCIASAIMLQIRMQIDFLFIRKVVVSSISDTSEAAIQNVAEGQLALSFNCTILTYGSRNLSTYTFL